MCIFQQEWSLMIMFQTSNTSSDCDDQSCWGWGLIMIIYKMALMGDWFWSQASNISAAGDVEHCTKLEAALVESFTLIFLHLQPYFHDHNSEK